MPSKHPTPASLPTARFGETLGYRFSGDTVELNAAFEFDSKSHQPQQWSLQLRASRTEVAGQELLLAEGLLPPLEELSGTHEPFFVTASASIPAGAGEFQLSLVLVSREAGQPERIHARHTFERTERFFGPRIGSAATFELTGKQAQIAISAITNTRSEDNLSGSLSVELWALPSPYSGGIFNGIALGGAEIGSLAGQQSLANLSYTLDFTPPPAGLWHLTLMLREWTGTGYITRDFRNIERPLLVEPTSPPAKSTPAAKASVSAPTESAKPAPSSPAKSSGKLSINTASVSELAKVKGLTKVTAAAIVAARPLQSLDQLAKIKGIGAKTLEKLRAHLVL